MKLLILDKDGTLVKSKSGNKFVQHPQDQELLPNVAETLQRSRDDGWQIAIASNQGGVAAGHKTIDEAIAEMLYCLNLLDLPMGLFCPDFEGQECWLVNNRREVIIAPDGTEVSQIDENGEALMMKPIKLAPSNDWLVAPYQVISNFRKPSWGMLHAAQIWTNKAVDECIFVGDRPEDQQATEETLIEFQFAKDFFGWT